MSRRKAPLISGVMAVIASFIVWLVMDNSVASSIIFALAVGLVACGVSWFQNRNRSRPAHRLDTV